MKVTIPWQCQLAPVLEDATMPTKTWRALELGTKSATPVWFSLTLHRYVVSPFLLSRTASLSAPSGLRHPYTITNPYPSMHTSIHPSTPFHILTETRGYINPEYDTTRTPGRARDSTPPSAATGYHPHLFSPGSWPGCISWNHLTRKAPTRFPKCKWRGPRGRVQMGAAAERAPPRRSP